MKPCLPVVCSGAGLSFQDNVRSNNSRPNKRVHRSAASEVRKTPSVLRAAPGDAGR